MVVHDFNPSTLEVEAGECEFKASLVYSQSYTIERTYLKNK